MSDTEEGPKAEDIPPPPAPDPASEDIVDDIKKIYEGVVGGADDGKPTDEKTEKLRRIGAAIRTIINLAKGLPGVFPCCPPAKSASRRPSKAKSPKPDEEESSFISNENRNIGNLSTTKRIDEESSKIFNAVYIDILNLCMENYLREDCGAGDTDSEHKCDEDKFLLSLISYKTQNVIGQNYFIKVKINNGPDHIHARIYEPIQGGPRLINTIFDLTENDEIVYF